MAHEIIAILPCETALLPAGLTSVVGRGATAVLAPAPGWAERLTGGPKQTAVRHHSRLEALMAVGSVLPFAAGIACTPEEAALLLTLDAPLIARLAAEIGPRRHFQLTLDWDESHVLAAFRDSPELAPLFSGAPVTPEIMRRAITALADRLNAKALHLLDPVAEDPVEQPRAPGCLLNVVFLLRPEDEPRLDAALEAIDALWTEGLRLRLVGPSAPISHALLDIDRADSAAVPAAADLLEVRPDAGKDAVVNAAKAALRSPDLAANAAEEIRAAARLLIRAGEIAALGRSIAATLPQLVHQRPGGSKPSLTTSSEAA
ncbi:hypothetical protein FBT96_14220 [Rhodobacter capsulatus]|uniref:Gas vesicle synthesis protein GvpL/GvpF n=1 Tax=Rhodobacter capsulatus TaxID=1061 RepID=A0A4U1JNI1_RHOCA|nr:GvpL/GvpF family gas vesicle protein [Rhodobacter capsulatus]TKD17477.1 hypothetical protein FBT96_14220 [Rhodobacter capsulatus]